MRCCRPRKSAAWSWSTRPSSGRTSSTASQWACVTPRLASPTGVFAAWYPIKHRAPVRAFHHALQAAGLHDIVAAELWLREPLDPARLNGCGLVVLNPPYLFEAEAPPILQALLDRLGTREPGEGTALLRLADE